MLEVGKTLACATNELGTGDLLELNPALVNTINAIGESVLAEERAEPREPPPSNPPRVPPPVPGKPPPTNPDPVRPMPPAPPRPLEPVPVG